MSNATETLVESIVADLPELALLMQEHLDDNDGELLPHVFFGDLTRWFVNQVAASSGDTRAAKHFVERLDAEYARGSADVRELITVSFLENLVDHPWMGRLLGPHLGPAFENLRTQGQDWDPSA